MLWNFIILTSERKEYLYELKDFSADRHTAEFIVEQIEIIINKVDVEKFAAIVSDNAANCAAARKQISEEYEHIFNVRCIAHCLNLISYDIIKHPFANRLIKNCNILALFFKQSTNASKYIKSLFKP